MIDSAVQELKDIHLISRLKARYVRLVDEKHWSELESLFASGFIFDGLMSVTGAEEFVEQLRQRLANASTTHALHVPEIEIRSPDTAGGTWPFSDVIDQRRSGVGLYRRGSGYYHETYRKENGEWLISTMRITRARVECSVFQPDVETRRHVCLSQEELIAWLGQQGLWLTSSEPPRGTQSLRR
jgi:hypothetical protein